MTGKLFWFFATAILYTYLGYPLLVAALARLKPYRSKQLSQAKELPHLTLLIAAYNEEQTIRVKLENSLSLKYPPEKMQILVAADGSSDRTPEIVKEFAGQGVELSFSPPRNGKMAAINRAISKATGEIIVFSDGNNLYGADTLLALVREFDDQCVGAVTGSKTIQEGDGNLGEAEGLYWKYEAFIRARESRLGSTTGVAGEVLAIRRELFETLPDEIINDDFFMAVRIIRKGYRVVYAPEARSFERISASAADEVTRRTRIVAGRYQALAHAFELLPFQQPLIVWQIVSHKFMRPLVPLAMIGALATNVIAALRPPEIGERSLLNLSPPWGRIFLALQTLFYGAAWFGKHIEVKGAVGKIFYLPVFLVNSNRAALSGLVKYLTGQQTARWQRVKRRELTEMGPTK